MLDFNAIVSALYLSSEYTIRSLYLYLEYSNILRQLSIKIKLPFEMDRSPTLKLLLVIPFVHVMLDVYTHYKY